MPDASLSEPAPWSELNVKSVVISEGITVIGQQNFCRMSSITSVSFPQSLQTIKEAAFYECSSLTEVKLAKECQNHRERSICRMYFISSIFRKRSNHNGGLCIAGDRDYYF